MIRYGDDWKLELVQHAYSESLNSLVWFPICGEDFLDDEEPIYGGNFPDDKELYAEMTTKIKNRQGLHARPKSIFFEKASSFKSKIQLEANGKTVDAKSILMIRT